MPTHDDLPTTHAQATPPGQPVPPPRCPTCGSDGSACVDCNPLPSIPREIVYDRAAKDYCATVDGNLIGFYPSYIAAETACDEYVYDLLAHGDFRTAAELDGGCDPDEIAADYAEHELTFSDLITLAINGPDEGPPVDNGPDDNWGGFRQPRSRVTWGR
jgi:hypothetical protein